MKLTVELGAATRHSMASAKVNLMTLKTTAQVKGAGKEARWFSQVKLIWAKYNKLLGHLTDI